MSESIFRPGLFTGRVAVVTGGGSGIGLGISTLLSSLGATVVIASRNAARLAEASGRMREAGGDVHPLTLDVRDHEGVKAAMAGIAEQHGRIDLLVNNAAGNFYVPSEQMSYNAWKAVLDIDLTGTFLCTQGVFPAMQRAGGGCVINISMTLHYRGWPMMAHATAAKAGIDALTRTLAVEWAPHGIRVNAVAPGPIPTEGVRKAFAPPAGSSCEADHSARALGKPRGCGERRGLPRVAGRLVDHRLHPGGRWGRVAVEALSVGNRTLKLADG